MESVVVKGCLREQSIRLIDGQEVMALVIKHSVGVVTTITYHLQSKKLDANYFAEV